LLQPDASGVVSVTIHRHRTRTFDEHRQTDGNGKKMVLEPFTLLRSGPIHKEAVRQMHRPNREPGFLGIAAFIRWSPMGSRLQTALVDGICSEHPPLSVFPQQFRPSEPVRPL